ncbi:MAG: efflux RND transporter periplasmic adaptor subunit [Bacteroidales bacterium]|nr:efflux RND transporter periplasmic adaptor subunit [Bacteroidales bacterium]
MKSFIQNTCTGTFTYTGTNKPGNLTILLLLLLFINTSCKRGNEAYDATGTFEATEVTISAEVNGKILQMEINEGDTVMAGQSIGAIDSIQLVLRKKQLVNNIRAIQSRRPQVQKQIAVLEQQISTQLKEKERLQRLFDSNAATGKQLDDINAGISLLSKQLEAQKSSLSITTNSITQDVATLETQIEQIEDQIKKCQITNPIKGTILTKYTHAHELATPGKPLYKIADLSVMVLRAYITSEQLSKVKLGQTVKVFTDYGDKSREYEGRVSWISPKSEFTPKNIHTPDERANLVYATKIEVNNDGFLKIGMYGQVVLHF